jgi:hypothetical protein
MWETWHKEIKVATFNWGVDFTYLADTDLDTSQYKFVVPASTAGYCKVCAVAGASVLGVLQNDPRAGEEATVRTMGYTKVMANANVAGSTITFGKFVKSGSDGQAQGFADVIATASGNAVGMAEETLASGSGIYVKIKLWSAPLRLYV